jgi:o-succinylbenzoate synthase
MIKAVVIPHTFHFNFPGGTSRGVLTEKPSFILKIWHENSPETTGFGEVSLIPGLSPEKPAEVEKLLSEFVKQPENFVKNANLKNFPAVRFGIETAFLDLKNGGKQKLFPSEFTKGTKGIRINGLVWMGEKNEMLKRLKEKVVQGFTCIKIKVGAIDFYEELSLLKYIRSKYSTHELEIRVDANGAFTKENALQRLNALAEFGIHSIEQPIKQGQWLEMAELCRTSPIPIALDEELIGINEPNKRIELLETIKPQYIILKPSLIGGLEEAKKWSNLAIDRHICWWVTSALEGNIGLNAIAQWTFVHGSNMPQGLGTGQVFTNNIASPLEIRGEELWYNPNLHWKLVNLDSDKNSTPVLRTHSREIGTGSQGGDKLMITPKQTETHVFESPENIPREVRHGGRGWNITLNGITYDLKNTDWNTLLDLNKDESWWQTIVAFLKEWANSSSSLTLTTSGSTGKPKQLEVGKTQMWLSASKTCDFFQLTENSTGLLCLSANYIAGKMMLVRAIVSGMNLICIEPSGNPVKELKTPINFAAMVPMQVEQSLSQITNLNLIKNLIVGGGQVSNSLALKLNPYTGKAFETFGMTETLSHIALRQLTPKYQNYFTPFNGVFILQVFNNEMVIDFPELGINKLKTNDIIEIINPAGCFVWKGRTDFIINSGGIKISPEEVESKIAHLIPQRFCICGVPDNKLGETVILIIEDKPFQTDALKLKIKEILPAYSCPKKIQFLSAFPLTETGKIKRKELVTLLQ